jgi:dipeptidyl-peptidase-3
MTQPESPFLCVTGFPVANLHTQQVISTLTPDQMKYATYLALASWAGFPILLSQVSPESPGIHDFLSSFISIYPLSELESAVTQPNTPLFFLLEYAAQFYASTGNYRGYGSNKFIPRISQSDLTSLVAPYPEVSAKLAAVLEPLYSQDPTVRTLGWPPKNVTAYYLPRDFTQEEQTWCRRSF